MKIHLHTLPKEALIDTAERYAHSLKIGAPARELLLSMCERMKHPDREAKFMRTAVVELQQ